VITQYTLAEVARQNIRLLIAEDNPVNQLVAQTLLKKQGYYADVVNNGSEALEALQRFPYDLVLMDCQMPVMDGFEATAAVRARGSKVLNPNVPIIALTAYAMTGDREQCVSAGMNDYLSKPLKPAELVLILDRWLPKGERTKGQTQSLTPAEVDPVKKVKKALPEAPYSQNSAVPVFDEAELLKRLMNDRDLEKIIVSAFLEDMPQQIDGLKQALAAGDRKLIYRMVHTIKGGSAYLSAQSLRLEAVEAEKLSENGDLESVAAILPRIEVEFNRFKQELAHLDILK
jgi:two-component system, sensor histidine kinase and response regulator